MRIVSKAVHSYPYFIRTATSSDLPVIRSWLEKEQALNGSSFIHNWDSIVAAQSRGSVSVCVRSSRPKSPIALSWFTHNRFEIMVVRYDLRHHGIGRFLATHCLRAVEIAGSIAVCGECAPSNSLPFWQSMGFVLDLPTGSRTSIIHFFRQSRHPPPDVSTQTFEFQISYDAHDTGQFTVGHVAQIVCYPCDSCESSWILCEDLVLKLPSERWRIEVVFEGEIVSSLDYARRNHQWRLDLQPFNLFRLRGFSICQAPS